MLTTTAPPRPAPSAARSSLPAPVPLHDAPGAPLRVVTDAELREATRRARARRLVAMVAGLCVAGLFGVVAAHVLLMQGQFELQRLQQESGDAQAEYDRLRLQVSELESPDRIVRVANEKLGMVSPKTITYLAPSSDPASLPPTTETTDDDARRVAASPGRWSSVKSQLSEG